MTTTSGKTIQLGNSGYTAEIMENDGRNITFALRKPGIFAIFRIFYMMEKELSNSNFSFPKHQETYFERLEQTDIPLSVRIETLTDTSLFVERHSQWILEYLIPR